ncbi:MAG: ABC transporter substrate-binding protein, partial [Gammaproteobacteria bacterium]|nr:ABC transporter substrate-binding protein [Gammaproteobacteria bacterium]
MKSSIALGVAGATPMFFVRNAWAQDFRNNPGSAASVRFGFNVPQTGAYADEGADELRAYQLAVKHINGEGDGGMLNTMQPLALKGDGVLGKKVEYVTGDTQTKSDAARASAKRMIEKDGVIMFSGGSSSGVAIAQQSLAQEMGIVFMNGLTHSNDT